MVNQIEISDYNLKRKEKIGDMLFLRGEAEDKNELKKKIFIALAYYYYREVENIDKMRDCFEYDNMGFLESSCNYLKKYHSFERTENYLMNAKDKDLEKTFIIIEENIFKEAWK